MGSRSTNAVLSFHESLLRQADVDLLKGPNWLNDTLISFYFEYLEIKRFQKNPILLFVPPDVTQCVKMSRRGDLGTFLDPLDAKRREFIFFALNDNEQTDHSGGSHWSLLVFSHPERMMFHFDSSRGSNQEQALELSIKLLQYFNMPTYGAFTEAASLQQSNSYDCGIHILCNAEHIADYACRSRKIENCPLVDRQTVIRKRSELLELIYTLQNSQ
ncbi:sentrin-specific protease 8 [Agrilus planipennis]|uniref:Sentrin-specific protease 8 n=1 Tax=Agrilus planipennis TaxID=224129 RepID=A0A1W4X9H4_AGRPL|nr:sentrin-specific protease 8 [Agrilus planipennis]